jgi:hypothetical protein
MFFVANYFYDTIKKPPVLAGGFRLYLVKRSYFFEEANFAA